jgi:hypothetical protein
LTGWLWGKIWKLHIINFQISCTLILNRIKCTSEFLNKIHYMYLFLLQNIDSCCTDLCSLKKIALLRKTDFLDSLKVTVSWPFTVSFCRWSHPSCRKTDKARYWGNLVPISLNTLQLYIATIAIFIGLKISGILKSLCTVLVSPTPTIRFFHPLWQCFSTFVRRRPGKFLFYKTRA